MQRAQEEVEAAEPKLSEGDSSALPPAVRITPLGADRRGALYWKLQCSTILAGEQPSETLPGQRMMITCCTATDCEDSLPCVSLGELTLLMAQMIGGPIDLDRGLDSCLQRVPPLATPL